ncbi:MAG: ZIP family metal transporter [DPANN group archaeon]|nr:ZIP family metal transporter [DPANN group archaeon]
MTAENIIFYSILAAVITIGSAGIFLKYKKWTQNNLIFLISFASGFLLSAAFIHLIPEAIELSGNNAMLLLLIGFSLIYVLEKTIIIHSCAEASEEHCEVHSMSKGAIIGLSIHSIFDGIAIGAGFEISQTIGLIAAIGVIIHKLPEGLSIMSIMLAAKYDDKKAMTNVIGIALCTPLGAILAYLFLQNVSQIFIGYALAFSAGTFIYIAASDLIPQTHEYKSINTLLMFGLGIIVLWAIVGI